MHAVIGPPGISHTHSLITGPFAWVLLPDWLELHAMCIFT